MVEYKYIYLRVNSVIGIMRTIIEFIIQKWIYKIDNIFNFVNIFCGGDLCFQWVKYNTVGVCFEWLSL